MSRMSRLGRYLSVLFVTLMLVVTACSKSVEGETKKWDANVGARLLYKLIGFALCSRPEGGSLS